MKKNGIGGANTKTGSIFEGKTDLQTFLCAQKGYSCKKNDSGWIDVFYNEKQVASIFKKHVLYRFLEHKGVDWKSVLSKKLLPDDSIYVVCNNTFFIVECKWQQVAGSVDEKLQTCDFKKKQYKKLMSQLNMEVEYVYLLSNWFKKEQYRDVLEYIISVGCSYHFGHIPLKEFGLPVPEE